MKITDIKATIVRSDIPDMNVGGGVPVIVQMSSTVVQVYTDEGIVGIGGSWVQETDEHILAAGIVHGLKPLLVGEDPSRVEKLWHKMWGVARNHGLHPAVSAVDIALWDIKGKALGVPIHQLLGGKYHDQVRAYATTPLRKPPKELAEQITRCAERGFTASKFAIGRGVEADKELMRIVRQNIPDEMGFAVDSNGFYDFHDALQVALYCDELGVKWYEEPVPYTQESALAELSQRVATPISGFQFGAGIDAMHRQLRQGSLDIYQPSLDKCGGISQAYKMSVMAEEWGKRFIPHSFAPGIPFCAALHVTACTRAGGWMEFPVPQPEPPDPGRFVFAEVLADSDKLSLTNDGFVNVPEDPGLGIILDEDRLRDLTIAAY